MDTDSEALDAEIAEKLTEYLCSKTGMFFYSNPFNDVLISENP
jgi:hypothetical protein